MKPFSRCCISALICLALICPAFLSGNPALADDDIQSQQAMLKHGAVVYAKVCASCHGKHGEGVETDYPEPLTGDLSIKELTAYIAETMPSEQAHLCVGKDAEAVAAFIHQEFYSVIAQYRKQPPRIQFSRLTNRQYRNSVIDLVNSFTWSPRFGDEQGLTGRYYKSRSQKKENLVIERIDHEINFRFEDAKPQADAEWEEQFKIVWTGSLLAPQTGFFQISLNTENGAQVWINDSRNPLIDARVKSGDKTDYQKEIHLIEGRLYPIRLELNKAKTDQSISIQLQWKPPHGPQRLIPSHLLSTQSAPQLIQIETDFPPDDKSVGYERGIQVSQEWYDAVVSASVEIVDQLLPVLPQMIKLPNDESQHEAKWREFCTNFATRAFRRPLSDDLKQLYIEQPFAQSENHLLAVKRSMLLVLQSPRFLFPAVGSGESPDHDVATWLALYLWDSIPDRSLLDSADKHQLDTPEQIQRQANRMLNDPRAHAKVREFFHQWLYFDHFTDLTKTQVKYPDFDHLLADDLKTSLELFVENIFWSDASDYRQLLNSDKVFLNPRLATFYKQPELQGPLFQFVTFEAKQRSGVITHPYLLAGLSYEDTTSPIHRGVFLSRSLLGRFLKPPPIAVTPAPVDLAPELTTRERVAEQTKSMVCQSCHGMINQLGFTLENFDEVGRFRQLENNKTIDASGVYISRTGSETSIIGAKDLAKFLIDSPESHQAFVEQFFQYLVKQPIQAFDVDLLPKLRDDFEKNNFNMQHIMAEIATQAILKQQAQQANTDK